jgi:hypothetical protein
MGFMFTMSALGLCATIVACKHGPSPEDERRTEATHLEDELRRDGIAVTVATRGESADVLVIKGLATNCSREGLITVALDGAALGSGQERAARWHAHEIHRVECENGAAVVGIDIPVSPALVEEMKRLAEQREAKMREVEELTKRAQEANADPGTIEVNSPQAGIWLRLGRTPMDTALALDAAQAHDLVLLHDGFEPTQAQVNGSSWSGAGEDFKASLSVALKASAKKTPKLPLQPTTPELDATGMTGKGPIPIDSAPRDAEVWLFLGANVARYTAIAGRDYELAVVRPGFITKHVTFHTEDWRDGGDPKIPIDSAKKKDTLSQTVELEPEPASGGK